MSCCNFVDDDVNEFEATESHHDNFLNIHGFMDIEEEYELDFTGEVEDGEEMDDFFNAKGRGRARRKRRRELRESGVSRRDARRQARAEVKGQEIDEQGNIVSKTKGDALKKSIEKLEEGVEQPLSPNLSQAQLDTLTAGASAGLGSPPAPKKAGSKLPIIIGAVAVLGIVGFIAYRKFGKGKA